MSANIRVCLVVLSALLLQACGSVPSKPLRIIGGQPKIQLPVTLYLSSNLCALEHDFEIGFKGIIDMEGEDLCSDAIKVVKSAFSNTVIARTKKALKSSPNQSLILFPRFVSANNTVGVWAGTESTMNVSVAWVAETPDKDVIWEQVFSGVSIGTGGDRFTYQKVGEGQLAYMLSDLAANTYHGIITSSEIITYARK